MTTKDFNELTAAYATERLSPLGFKKAGINFYLHKTPNLMVLYKETFRGTFEGFCIAVTHDFFPEITDGQKGKLNIPPYLENYPFSIPLDALKDQYTKHKTAADFTYDTNFITRKVLSTRQFTPQGNLPGISSLQHDLLKAEHYIQSSLDTVVTDGMRLFNEYSPLISYLAVTRHKHAENSTLDQFRVALEKYLSDNGIEVPKKQTNWFSRLFNKD